MGIAISLQNYLLDNGIEFDSIEHRPTSSSSETAIASFVPGNKLAKGVVVKNREAYLVTVLPSTRKADLNKIGDFLHQPVALALEEEIIPLFPDCEQGAIPPIGDAYGMLTIVDEDLDDEDDVYFEAGDHCTLVHLSAGEFRKLTQKSAHVRICTEQPAGKDDMSFGYFGA
ncbi:MAG: aminoacyl-tRNA deacylase [Rhizobiaceae bacterium]